MEKNKIFLTFLSCLLLIPIIARADSGETSGITLNKPVTASQAVLHGAVSGDRGLKTFGINPAGMTGLEYRELTAMYNRGHFDDNFFSALYGQELFGIYLGANVVYRATGKIGLYTSVGEYVEKIGQEDIILSFTSAVPDLLGENMHVGINFSMLESSIFGYTATSYLIDAGTQKTLYFGSGNICWGASIRNLGTELKYLEKKSKLPTSIQTGVKLEIDINNNKLFANSDLRFPINSEDIYLKGGISYKAILSTEETFTRGKIFDSLMFMSGGKINLTSDYLQPKINFGVKIESMPYTFTYAINLVQEVDLGHYVSLGLKI